MTSIVSLTEIVGPPVFGSILRLVAGYEEWYIHGLPFLVGACSVAVAMAIFLTVPMVSDAERLCMAPGGSGGEALLGSVEHGPSRVHSRAPLGAPPP